MAVTATHLVTSRGTTDTTVYTTASITPTANRLVLAFISSKQFGSGTVAAPTLSGNGLTWVLAATVSGTTNSDGWLFRAMGASPSAGGVTITFSATQSNCNWSISEFAGVDTGGTNGSAAIVQTAVQQTNSATSCTVTLGTFGAAGNATFGGFHYGGNAVISAGSGFTLLGGANGTGAANAIMTEWRSGNDTSVDASQSTSDNWWGAAAEIKEASGAQTVVPTEATWVIDAVAQATTPAATTVVTTEATWAPDAIAQVSAPAGATVVTTEASWVLDAVAQAAAPVGATLIPTEAAWVLAANVVDPLGSAITVIPTEAAWVLEAQPQSASTSATVEPVTAGWVLDAVAQVATPAVATVVTTEATWALIAQTPDTIVSPVTVANTEASWVLVAQAPTVSVGGAVTGLVKVWTGSIWDSKPAKVWTGSAWVQYPIKRWNGVTWV